MPVGIIPAILPTIFAAILAVVGLIAGLAGGSAPHPTQPTTATHTITHTTTAPKANNPHATATKHTTKSPAASSPTHRAPAEPTTTHVTTTVTPTADTPTTIAPKPAAVDYAAHNFAHNDLTAQPIGRHTGDGVVQVGPNQWNDGRPWNFNFNPTALTMPCNNSALEAKHAHCHINTSASQKYTPQQHIEATLRDLNYERSLVGARPLTLDRGLSASAQAWADRTIKSGNINHDFARSTGYFKGENISVAGPQEELYAYNQFLRHSPGHYDNMISTDYTKVGFGFAEYNGRTILVERFL